MYVKQLNFILLCRISLAMSRWRLAVEKEPCSSFFCLAGCRVRCPSVVSVCTPGVFRPCGERPHSDNAFLEDTFLSVSPF